MKKNSKKCVSLFLAAIMILSIAPTVLFAITPQAADTTYQNGDIIEFGSYPQSEVKDSALLAELNKLSTTWISYGYYSGTGNREDGQMTAKDYMKYADVTYNENMYRAVTFSSYRPEYTGGTSSSSDSYQDDNGYTTNNVYWFKYEPLKWRVLDSTGLVICETIIDSQPYHNYCLYASGEYYGNSSKTYYANNYANSSIREWLNDDFYNTAFTSSEKKVIKRTTLDNSADQSFSYSRFDSASTNDKVFLLSYSEAENTYFKNDTARKASGSDYAKCQGLIVSWNDWSFWRLRSVGDDSCGACHVHHDGDVYYYSTYYTDFGVRPSLTLDFMNISDPDINDPDNNDPDNNDPDNNDPDNNDPDNNDPDNNDPDNNDPDNNDPDNNDPDNNDPDNNDPDTITEPTGISIKNSPAKTEYIYKQDKLDLSGIELLVTYSDGTTETVTDTAKMTVTGFSNTVIGEQTVTVEYEGLKTSFKVNVKYVWWQWIIIILLFGWIWY